jgi:hypothetical protein
MGQNAKKLEKGAGSSRSSPFLPQAYYRLSSAPSAITYGSIPAFSIVAEVILSGFEQVRFLCYDQHEAFWIIMFC